MHVNHINNSGKLFVFFLDKRHFGFVKHRSKRRSISLVYRPSLNAWKKASPKPLVKETARVFFALPNIKINCIIKMPDTPFF